MKIGKHFYSWGTIDGLRSDIVTIGDYVILGAGSVIITHCPISFYNGQPVEIVIGNNVYIGSGVCVLPGVTIGDNVMIGAGSVVSSSIPSNVVAAGNPCRPIRELTEKEATRIRLMTEQQVAGTGKEPKWD